MSLHRPGSQLGINEALRRAMTSLSAGKIEEALETCRRALAQFPGEPKILYAMGVALTQLGRPREAVTVYQEAIKIDPNFFEGHANLGSVYTMLNRLPEALAEYSKAASLRPDLAENYVNLSNVYRGTWQLDQAVAFAEKAIAMKPSLAEAPLALGAALACRGEYDRAIAIYRDTIRIRPDFPAAHLNLALALLATGNLAEGLPEYEWRRRCPGVLPPRPFPQPAWKGENPAGKTILLYPEQGFGDAIHFIRYLPMITQQGAKVIVECAPPLCPLFQLIPGIERVIPLGQPLGQFDMHCSLLSLPYVFKTTLESIPALIPYLSADPQAVESWRKQINRSDKLIQVGLAWAGSSENLNDRNRSIPLSKFAPLAAGNKFQFHSLQITPPPADGGFAIKDWSANLKNFADTAALLANLDLVISVDTAVAHLAGAMGKKVWLLIGLPSDWRWQLSGTESKWYPTIRLFRQTTPGDWDAVIQDLAQSAAQF